MKSKKMKKILTVGLTAALLAATVSLTASAANLTGINTSFKWNFDKDASFQTRGASFFKGYYQTSSQKYQHNPRAGTHYHTGTTITKGKAYVTVSYISKKGKTDKITKSATTHKEGWVMTPWAEIPDSAKMPKSIEFKGIKYFKTGNTITDKMTVNK